MDTNSFINQITAASQLKDSVSKYRRLLHKGSEQIRLFETNFPPTTESEGCMRDPIAGDAAWAFPSRNVFIKHFGDNRDG